MTKHIFKCIDGHTCGNPVRLVISGAPPLEGKNQSERRRHFLAEYDWVRTGLMYEPRGHNQMSGAFLYPPTDDDYDVAVLFIETSGCLPMCGHGTIGVVTMAIEQNLVTPKTPGILRLETPAGLVIAEYKKQGEYVESVKITNVPSFVYARDIYLELPALGVLKIDVCYGGNFYPIIEAQENYRDLSDFSPSELINMGRNIYLHLNEQHDFVHPLDDSIRGIRHCLWTGKPTHKDAHARNAVIYGDNAIDRSPCGTGTSARIAHWAAQGKLVPGQDFVHESIIGSLFTGRIEATTQVSNYPAVIPSIEGWARITGFNEIIIDDRDPYANGFLVV